MLNLQHLVNHNRASKEFKKRVFLVTIILILLISILIVRLFNLQIFNYKRYVGLATNNRLEYIPIEPNRGLIYDRNGVLLAENLPIFSLDIVPEKIRNLDTTLDSIRAVVDVKTEEIQRFKQYLKRHRRFDYISLKFKLTPDEVAAFYANQYRFPGVIINNRMIRHYPLANNGVHVLGYVGRIDRKELKNINNQNYNCNDFIGKVGIEKYYETLLRGKIGYKVVETDANGRIARVVKIIPPIPGENLYLTIDSGLQQAAKEALDNELGAVVAIDPNNGEVLALVSSPDYNPNTFATTIDNITFEKLQHSQGKPMYNRATRSIFPFGSTIKPFLAIGGLDAGVITSNYEIMDPGWFKLENSRHPPYRDWKYNGHGIVDVAKAITESCSTFFYDLAVKLGIEKMATTLEGFGFGHKTNIDIFEESSGIIATPKWKIQRTGKPWYLGDTVVAGIGQGYMKTTPLQLAQGVAAIAMRGERYQPHLLLATESPDKQRVWQKIMPLTPIKISKSNIWNLVIKAMQKVIVSPKGNAYRRFGRGMKYSVAGKTGTAQLYHHKIVNENPTPESNKNIPKHLRNHSLFIAFAPVENPQIAIAVIIENGMVAPTVARKVLDYYLTDSKYNK